MTTITAVVTRVLKDQGYAFARVDDERQLFIHRTACADFSSLEAGDVVAADAVLTDKGWRARSVRRPSPEAANGDCSMRPGVVIVRELNVSAQGEST